MIHGSNLLSNIVGIGSSLHDLLAICLISFEMYSAETGWTVPAGLYPYVLVNILDDYVAHLFFY